MSNLDRTYAVTTANRLRFADMLETLDNPQWDTQTLCEGWSVRTMAGHLVTPLLTRMTLPWTVRTLVAFRGDSNKAMDHLARHYGQRLPGELVATLRQYADARLNLPVVGPSGQMTDSFIHMRDIARPLGLATTPEPDEWRLPLDFLVSKRAQFGFVPRGRVAGLRFEATDLDWSYGSGPEIRGTGEALALALTGRAAVLAEISGSGAAKLAATINK